MHEHITHFTTLDTPVGELLLSGNAEILQLIAFPTGSRVVPVRPHWRRDDALYPETKTQFTEYFAGERTRFTFPMQMVGTDFQKSVWHALRTIPHGATTTYGGLAKRIGRPKASRAVGAANGANPLSIVVPCHRVVGSTGALTGFGGGLEVKKYLLSLESRTTG